jgi:hypothetical protein
MVHGQQEDVVFLAQADQTGPDQRTLGQIEWCRRFLSPQPGKFDFRF